jgi:hypothetical protein
VRIRNLLVVVGLTVGPSNLAGPTVKIVAKERVNLGSRISCVGEVFDRLILDSPQRTLTGDEPFLQGASISLAGWSFWELNRHDQVAWALVVNPADQTKQALIS